MDDISWQLFLPIITMVYHLFIHDNVLTYISPMVDLFRAYKSVKKTIYHAFYLGMLAERNEYLERFSFMPSATIQTNQGEVDIELNKMTCKDMIQSVQISITYEFIKRYGGRKAFYMAIGIVINAAFWVSTWCVFSKYGFQMFLLGACHVLFALYSATIYCKNNHRYDRKETTTHMLVLSVLFFITLVITIPLM